MGNELKQNQLSIWVQQDRFTPFAPLAVGDKMASLTGVSIPIVSVAASYTRDAFGSPLLLSLDKTPPGDVPSATLTIIDKKTLNFFEKLYRKNCPFAIQRRVIECGILDDQFSFDKIMHMDEGALTVYNPGDGPSIEFSEETVTAAGTISFPRIIFMVNTSLSNQTSGLDAAILAIDGIRDNVCEDCGDGYPGADRVLFAGTDATPGSAAVLWTNTGGGTWAQTSAAPFAAGEVISDIVAQRIGVSTVRLFAARGTTDGANPAEYAWADVVWGDEGTTVWTLVDLPTPNGEFLTAALAPYSDRLYLASDQGEIYVSQDQGSTVEPSPIYSGAVVINGFVKDPSNDTVWAFGETNLILREQEKGGTFNARVGPSGGGTFTALAIASDGTMYAGNGTSLYRNENNAANTGGWTLVRDFGANKRVVGIHPSGEQRGLGGSPQVLEIVVDDTTPGAGRVYRTWDGGVTLSEVPELTNSGYNDAYFSEADDNYLIAVGDSNAGEGIIHVMTPDA